MTLDEARSNAEATAQDASSFGSGKFTIGSQLKKTINDIYASNQDLIQPKNEAMANFMSSPSQATAKYGRQFDDSGKLNQNFILNPLAQNAAIQREINNSYIPFSTYSDLLGMRTGSINDIVSTGVGGYNQEAQRKADAASLAQQTLQQLIQEDQFNRQLAQSMAIARMNAGAAGAGTKATLDAQNMDKMNKAKGLVMQALQGGKIKTADEIRASLLSAGVDPNDPFFSELYGMISAAPATDNGNWFNSTLNYLGDWNNSPLGEQFNVRWSGNPFNPGTVGGFKIPYVSDFLGNNGIKLPDISLPKLW